MAKEISDFEKAMNQEIENRISQLENEEYDLGKPFNKVDWFFVGVAIFVGAGMIIWGLV
ncbi:hypothetical protein [Phosphitispora fastidiosa]|uniref:hypothetical protein n=1 Tax=Phosphitispora fastidiosa TaxID=2837202 RepID=UPI001E4688B1|nr:hypothetical protein [Phosphitispora fastidiosa]MBU7005808.1 hypothetical protein [Phosphitispora fastidiosa]